MLKTSKIILYYTILYIFLVCIANGKFFEKKVMLLFPNFYIVKEKFWIPFSGEKEKVREEPTKVIKSSHGTKMKEWTETERILAKQNFFLKFFACKKWVFAVYRHTFTFTKKLTPSFRDPLFNFRVNPGWKNRKLWYH